MKKQNTLYMQVYEYYRELIENGKLKNGEKLPSIRRSALELQMSKTTIEQAYMCLCDDGYLVPKNQSGYYVSRRGETKKSSSAEKENLTESTVTFDFASSGVDKESFDLSLWRRYLKSALRQTERLLNYGEVQGEEELREEIAAFAKENRNCVCTAENIVIGAGVQSLLHILCPLIKPRKSVFFDDVSYVQGTSVFCDHGFKIASEKDVGDIIYTSPSRLTKWGDTMSVSDRFKLTEYARKTKKIIIEDDYGSEFRYVNSRAPSLQGLDGGENVVYIGTFSKLLLPSIRISFMILPESLLEKYRKISQVYSQTVSKADQIALCSFIRDGHLSGQIRKSKKLYSQKSKLLSDALTSEFKNNITFIKTDSPLFVRVALSSAASGELLLEKAKEKGLRFILVLQGENLLEIAFSVSAISSENIAEGVSLLKSLITSCELQQKKHI